MDFKIIGVIISTFCIGMVHFNFPDNPENYEYTKLQDYKEIIYPNLDQVQKELAALFLEATHFKHKKTSVNKLQSQLAATRNSYKKVEFILTYFYPEHCKAYINGAPLRHVDPNPIDPTYLNQHHYTVSPKEYAESLPLDYRDKDHFRGKAKLIDPVGLQTLDEVIFSDNPRNEIHTIIELIEKLSIDFKTISETFKKRKYIADFEIIEAVRLQLIRIFSLGITGFDTPGSLNAVQEAEVSLQSLQKILQSLWKQTQAKKQKELRQIFENARKYLNKNQDFETFDRLTFLVDYINPLYQKIGTLQTALEIPSSSEKYAQQTSWNAYSDNIFAEDFLNPYYYSLLPAENDTKEARALGKKLFYDTSLSNSEQISCASCHQPQLAFTDRLPKSKASVKGKFVLRNAPSLINTVFSDRFFYDLRAYDLEDQAEHVITDHLEYNTTFTEISKKLNADPEYAVLFQKAFNNTNNTISRAQFALALSAYVISLTSFNSAFDQYVRGESDNISQKAKNGFNLFMGKANCATCHFPPTFSGLVPPLYQESESEVLGVLKSPDILQIDPDPGRIDNGVATDHFPIYQHSFKTVSVRNSALTAPYFHHGGYETLEEVLDFYNQGGAAGMGLSNEIPNQTLSPDPLDLSNKEIKEIIAFITSLNDNPFLDH